MPTTQGSITHSHKTTISSGLQTSSACAFHVNVLPLKARKRLKESVRIAIAQIDNETFFQTFPAFSWDNLSTKNSGNSLQQRQPQSKRQHGYTCNAKTTHLLTGLFGKSQSSSRQSLSHRMHNYPVMMCSFASKELRIGQKLRHISTLKHREQPQLLGTRVLLSLCNKQTFA